MLLAFIRHSGIDERMQEVFNSQRGACTDVLKLVFYESRRQSAEKCEDDIICASGPVDRSRVERG